MPWTDPGDGSFPTLGYTVAVWMQDNIPIPDGEFQGTPYILSDWQLRFLLHYYRLHPNLLSVADDPSLLIKPSRAFVYDRGGQLVAPQKTGKGPFTAAQGISEAYGPVLFDGWDANGQPVGRPWATPWVQVAAISHDQTDNVWRSLQPMIELGKLAYDIPDTGITRVNLPGGGKIEPVTSSARSRLGQRVTFCVQDEAMDWNEKNGGRKLADTQRRNLAGMGGRFVESGNAWDPNEFSVAQQTQRETGVYKMFFEPGRGSIRNKRERMQVLNRLYAESWWVDVDRISSEVDTLVARGEVAQAERFFMNRVLPSEDRAFDGDRWEELAREDYHPAPNSLIVIGCDGARYEDTLAVVATEVSTGYQWLAGLWEKPQWESDDYEHPLSEVDDCVSELFDRYSVWRMYIDPGSQTANISILVEKWQGRWTDKRVLEWLMNRPRLAALMVRRYASAILIGDVSHDGDARMTMHIRNARRRSVTAYDDDGRRLWNISKEAPGSANKIDAAAAGALSWEARGDAVSAGAKPARRSSYASRPLCNCGNPERAHFADYHAVAAG